METKNKNDGMRTIEKNLQFLKDNNLIGGTMNNGSQISQYAGSKSSQYVPSNKNLNVAFDKINKFDHL